MSKRFSTIGLFALFVLFLLGKSVLAEELTLVQALKLGIENNTEVIISELDREIAEGNYQIAKKSLFPEIKLNSNYTRLEQVPFGSPNVYRTTLSLQQPIFLAGKLLSGIELAEKGIELIALQGEQKKESLVYNIINSYYGVLMARERLEIEEEALKLIEEHKRIVQANIKAGLALKTDLLQVEIEEGNSLQNLREARNKLYLARRSLGIMIGTDLTAIDFIVPELALEIETGFDYLYQQALLKRPEIQLLALNQEMTELNLSLKKKDRYPNIILIGNYGWQGEEFSLEDGSWDLSLSLSFPVFDGRKSVSEQKNIEKELAQLAHSIKNLQEMIALELEEQLMKLKQNQNNIELQQINLEKSEDNFRLSSLRFEAGLGTNIDLINARTMVKQAKMMLMQAEYQYHLNLASLLYKTGSLFEHLEEVINHEK